MKFYEIALPINIQRTFIYCSKNELPNLIRVVVGFTSKLKTGIILKKAKKPSFKCREIIENIDEKPIVNNELFRLATWISKYYFSPIGVVLFTMLPSGIHIKKMVKRKDSSLNRATLDMNKILQNLDYAKYISLESLKKQINDKHLIKKLLEMEKLDLVEFNLSSQFSKKVLNFVIPQPVKDLPKLTKIQKKLWEKISNNKSGIFLSELTTNFSYSVLNALVKKDLVKIEKREKTNNPLFKRNSLEKRKIKLTDEQVRVNSEIITAIKKDNFKPFLLYGITGSGKTEIYLKAIKKTLEIGKSSVLLVPEISLTPMMIDRFCFSLKGDTPIFVLHSNLSEKQRKEQWEAIRNSDIAVVIGARSAIFAPLNNIGLIVVDEEHENSYKQSSSLRYNARDIAIVRAKFCGAVIILGSATPSLESWQNAKTGKYNLLSLLQRPANYKIPKVEIVDMKNEKEKLLSSVLKEKINKTLKDKKQIILLQNRRGYSSFLQCISCGDLIKCEHCDITLSYHSITQNLMCHYCGFKIAIPRNCPSCKSFAFRFGSTGTQKVELELKEVFPTARVLRIDTDSTRKSGSFNNMFDLMKNKKVDILLGTQMIAKGLDFEGVTLVGVLSVDQLLNIPDYKAGERGFSLLTQVAGRSGRGEFSGEVVFQSYNPQHYVVLYAKDQNFIGFAEKELKQRRLLSYAPYYKIVRVLFTSEFQKLLEVCINSNTLVFQKLKKRFKSYELKVLGPTPAPITKINKKFFWHIVFKAKNRRIVESVINFTEQKVKLNSKCSMTIDVDPGSLM